MEQADFIHLILSELRITNFEKDTRDQIKQYLLGELEDIKLEQRQLNAYTMLFRSLELEMNTDNKEISKRAYHVIEMLYPKKLYTTYQHNSSRFEKYKSFGLSSSFIKFDIIESMNSSVQSWNSYFKNRLSQWIAGPKKDKTHEWTEIFTYYSSEVEEILKTQSSQDAKTEMAQLILPVLSYFWYQNDEDKKKAYLAETEEKIYGLIKQLYTSQRYEKAFASYFGDQKARDYIESVQPLNIFYNVKHLKKVMRILTFLLYKESPLLADACKLMLVETDSRKFMKEYEVTIGEMNRVYQAFALPVSFSIRLYAGLMIAPHSRNDWENFSRHLISLYHDYTEDFHSEYRKAVRDKEMEALVFLPVLLLNDDAGPKEIEECEDILFFHMEKLQEQTGKNVNRGFQVLYKSQPCRPLSLLRQEDFSLEKAEIYCAYYEEECGEFIVCAAYNYSYSVAARNIACLMLNCNVRNWNNSGIVLLSMCKTFFEKEADSNVYETLAQQIDIKQIIDIYIDYGASVPAYKGMFCAFLKNHLEEAREQLQEYFKNGKEHYIKLLELLFLENSGMDVKEVVPGLTHKLKSVVNYMETFLLDKEKEARSEVEALQKTKNKNAREAITRLLRAWDADRIALLLQTMEGTDAVVEFVKSQYSASNDKLIPYGSLIDFTAIRLKDSEEKADPVIAKYYITEYMMLKELHIIHSCEKVKEILNPLDFRKILKEIYQLWLENQADTKQKNILLPYALNCTDGEITELKKQIDTWTENARGALAAFAVTAMALNGGNIALLLTDSISNKYKNKQVKSAAAAAMSQVAAALHITTDDLGDKIVPNLGFDLSRKRIFDYGSRKFTANLNDKLEITLTDEKGKAIKSLPKANASDDAALAEQAKEELKGLKKQLKTVVATQKNRLETALITGRAWEIEAWKTLFVENPIMNCFATGLIWAEADKKGNLLGSFRYMEDGSFNTCDEEEYTLQEDSKILLLHPIDFEPEVVQQWQEQLADYEVSQPFEQLSMPIYTLLPEEREIQDIIRFAGANVYFGTIRGVAEKYGLKRTSIIDGGGYDGYYYEDSMSNIGMQINFEYIYVGMMANDTAKVCNISFYKSGTISYGSYCYDEINNQNRVLPRDVPPKFLSFALLIGDLIAQKQIQ